MMVCLLARLGANRHSGLQVDGAYGVDDGPAAAGQVPHDAVDPASPRWVCP
jgi:hypothetical protein